MKSLKVRIVFCALCLLICSIGRAQLASSSIKTYTSKSGRLSVEVSAPKVPCQSPPHWLNEQRGRVGCIGGLLVVRSGVKAYFPDFSYNFLESPRTVEIKEEGKGYVLTLVGGDASSTYIADFAFERDSLKRRRIASATFPDQAWEEATFKFNMSEK